MNLLRHLPKKFLTSHFTMNYHPTVTGLTIPVTDMSGARMQDRISNPMPATVTGFIQMPDGLGPRTTTGVGRPFTMAVGFTKTTMAGCGFREINGLRLG